MNPTEKIFLQAAQEWICDGYSLDIRYVERLDLGAPQLWEALLGLSPVPPSANRNFSIATSAIVAGQQHKTTLSAKEAFGHVEDAVRGQILVDARAIRLADIQLLSFYSEPMHKDKWFAPLALDIRGTRSSPASTPDMNLLDTQLRRALPPFDGVADLYGWLGLADQQLTGAGPVISVNVMPPADLNFQRCLVRDDRLELELVALESFDTANVGLAVRLFPGEGLLARQQIAPRLRWSRPRRGLKRGRVTIKSKGIESALTMLTFGSATVRRQWFVDSTKARNSRLAAVQLFDRDLRMIRQAVTQSSDGTRFELGVEALLFLLGFAPAVMIERDAPDLIVATPSGRLVLIECTTRIADFHSKLGKLIDRRGALVKSMQTGGHVETVAAVLACALPRDQIAISDAELTKHSVLLVTAETLSTAFDQVRFPLDPDGLLDRRLSLKQSTASAK